jgi:hypothetical protein
MIFILSIFELYPYGGRMRHQFVLFPFLVFVLLFVADEIFTRLRSRTARGLLCIVFAAATLATSADSLSRTAIEEFSPTPSLWSSEIQSVLDARQPDDALYFGAIDGIAVFSNLRDRRWRLHERGSGMADVFMAEKQGEPPIRMLRESTVWWLPSPLDAPAAARLANVMRRTGTESTWILALVFDALPITPERADDSSTRTVLREQGLALERRSVFESGEALRVTLLP